jgi:hypothetical protein
MQVDPMIGGASSDAIKSLQTWGDFGKLAEQVQTRACLAWLNWPVGGSDLKV